MIAACSSGAQAAVEEGQARAGHHQHQPELTSIHALSAEDCAAVTR